jgi:hypothetical protein
MNAKRPSTGPLSSRQIASQFGISRAAQWRAKKIADIPEEEFEAPHGMGFGRALLTIVRAKMRPQN